MPRSPPTRAARVAAGKWLRQRVPRSAHARWVAAADRPDPVETLRASDRGRIPALLPIRYGRMAASPFAFLRGAASVMAQDLATTPTTRRTVQLCGDAHLGNFGIFASPERALVFDANDFDETLRGPWEWDVKRLATSLFLAARQEGFPKDAAREAARTAVRAYRKSIRAFAQMRYLDVWYSHIELESADEMRVGGPERDLLSRAVKQARSRTGLHAFPKLVRAVRGGYRIRDDPPLIVHYQDPARSVESRLFFDRYLDSLPDDRRVLLDRYHVADVAQKVVGVGSVGTACSVVLLVADPDVADPLLLQLKEATASVLEAHLPASPYANHAERVVQGQHLIQEASDVFLGWSRLRSRDFYVRQLLDMKFSYDVTVLGPEQYLAQASLCGRTLARAHARTGDAAGIAGYLGGGGAFDAAVTRFAEAYSEQTVLDHARLVQAIRRHRVIAAPA